MLFDLGPVIGQLKSGSYVVTRFGGGDYVEGAYVAGETETLTIEASVQPASGKELQRLPEGERTSDYLSVWTQTELFGRQESKSPDRILVDGYTYEVALVNDWLSEGGYVHAVVQRLDEPRVIE